MHISKLKRLSLTTCNFNSGLKNHGFTLVEMLVSIVISSLIFVSSYQVISNLVQYQVKAKVHNNEELDRSLIVNLISQIIEKSIHPYNLIYRIPDALGQSLTENSIKVVSRAYSKNYDSPGYRVYALDVRDGELFISHRKYDKTFMSNQQFEIATGLKVKKLGFQYFHEGQWQEEWSDQKVLPGYIKVGFDSGNQERQEFVRKTGSK